MQDPCCEIKSKKDWFLISTMTTITLGYGLWFFAETVIADIPKFSLFCKSIFDIFNQMWWGLLLGVLAVGLLNIIPRQWVFKVLGQKAGVSGVVRATIAGVLLDLCCHGVLLVGMKFYRQGLSLGQVMALLIASPWNSFSLMVILFALIGWQWTLAFVGLSMVIGMITGLMFQGLVRLNWLPENPNHLALNVEQHEVVAQQRHWFKRIFLDSITESRMIFRWIFFGIVAAALIRTFISLEDFQTYFGPTMSGLFLTLVIATVIEVCSEGTVPIASDLLNLAGAPGNAFAFLMTGVATDYTEILAIKETTGRWLMALLLPVITVPQVLVVSWVLNNWV